MADDPRTESWSKAFFRSADPSHSKNTGYRLSTDSSDKDLIKFFSTPKFDWVLRIIILRQSLDGSNQPLLFSWQAECQRSADTDYLWIVTMKRPAYVDNPWIQSLRMRMRIRGSKCSRTFICVMCCILIRWMHYITELMLNQCRCKLFNVIHSPIFLMLLSFTLHRILISVGQWKK